MCANPCVLRPEVIVTCLLHCLYNLFFEIALFCHNLYYTAWPFYLAGEFPEPICCLHSQHLLKDYSPLLKESWGSEFWSFCCRIRTLFTELNHCNYFLRQKVLLSRQFIFSIITIAKGIYTTKEILFVYSKTNSK